MKRRLITTALLWAIILAVLLVGGESLGEWLLLGVALLAGAELAQLIRRIGLGVNSLAILAAIGLALGGHLWGWASVGTALGLIVLLGAHFAAAPAVMVAALMAAIGVSAGLGAISAIAHLPDPRALIWAVWVVAVIKLSDANAYLVGRYLGRRPLAQAISPAKTVEGLFGAILGGLIIGVYGAPLFDSWWVGPLLGVIMAAVGVVGDLLESYLKRRAGVKDSGALLPGIGGALDLTDSLLLAAPVGYLLLRLVG
jgi:phosphatidate cytidylyltransferase